MEFKTSFLLLVAVLMAGCGQVVGNLEYSQIKRSPLSSTSPMINALNMQAYPVSGSCVTEAGDVTVEIGNPVVFTQVTPCVDDQFSLTAALTASSYYINGTATIRLSQMVLNKTEVVPTDSIMITRWQLTDPDLTVTLPLVTGHNYDFSVDWGDGSPLGVVSAFNDPDAVHTYASAGTYQIRIIGQVQAWGNAAMAPYATGGCRITEVLRLGNMGYQRFRSGFFGCNLLTTFNSDRQDVANVVDMEWMFRGSIVNPSVGHWDVSQVTDMGGMFESNPNANPDVSRWDVGQVRNTWSMFYRALSANPDVSQWNTANFQTCQSMFDGASVANPDVSQWNVSNIVDMRNMFRDTPMANPDTRLWSVPNVTNFRDVFGVLNQSSGITAERYSDFLNMVANTSARTNLRIDSVQYYLPSAAAARADLVSRGWIINDAGLQP